MNITDTGNAVDTLRIDMTAVRNKQPENNRAERNTEQLRQVNIQDKYVQNNETVNEGALYSISDVRGRRRISRDDQLQENRSTLNGQRITGIVLDMILPPGVKNLTIFRTEE